MGTKLVFKLNILVLILLITPFYVGHSQIKDPVHLSFNIKGKKNCVFQKMVSENNVIQFYISGQHFEYDPKDSQIKELPESDLKNISIINIESLEKMAKQERKRLIKEGEKNKSIKILFNNQVFDKIYLYEKTNDHLIKRYEVIWIEEIE